MGGTVLTDTLAQLREAVAEMHAAQKRAAESAYCPNCGAAMTLAAHQARAHALALAEQWYHEDAHERAARSPQP